MTREFVYTIIDEWLKDKAFYLVELDVLPASRIMVFVDGDEGVTIEDCVGLSRFIEGRLNREEHDYELNVSSAGMDRPLRHPRQFSKAIGKLVEMKLFDGKKLEGTLNEVSAEHYVIEIKQKKSNKKNPAVMDPILQTIPVSEVKEVKRAVTFS